MSREALEDWQERHAIENARSAQAGSPFYRERSAGLLPEDWRCFPMIDKRAMMESFDTFNTRGVTAARALEVALRAETTRDFSPTVDGLTVGLIGVSCHEGRLHMQEDLTFVELEPLGEGRFTPVMTQLFRRVQPFIRYRMNDVITVDDRPCPCGSVFRVIGSVEGRCDDAFYLRRKTGALKLVFPGQLRRAFLEKEGIMEYRVEQLATDRIRVSVERGADIDGPSLIARMCERMGVEGCEVPSIEVQRGIPVEVDRRRKLIRVRRLFSPTEIH